MPGQRRWGPSAAALGMALALSALFACSRQLDAVAISDPSGSPGYEFGGQTGSLLPGCGLAPLSAEGSIVPTGKGLAILYTKDCPAALAQSSVALGGADSGDVTLTLVPLDGDGVYLVQADQRVYDGSYALSVGGDASSLTVGGAVALPGRVGALTAESSAAECEDSLRFLMTDRATLAYAPIARFTVRIDGGEEQLWVDYGALPITGTAEGSSAEFVLPRCGPTACLPAGHHQLLVQMDVAGVDAQPEPSRLDFDVSCPLPEFESDAASDTDSGCTLAVPPAGSAQPLALLALLGACLGRRRSRREQG